MEILLIFAVGIMNICCFIIGVKTGQKTAKGEEVVIPSFNPVKAVRTAQEKREADAEYEKYKTLMENIDNYDGTEYGQKDVS